jgi:putative transposase
MGNHTYTKIYLQIVFAVKYRKAVINESWENELFSYITGIVQNNSHKMIRVNGVADHIHLLVGYKPNQNLSDLVRDIKCNSTNWINDNHLTNTKFNWQEGYGAFSYTHWDLDKIINYIINQKQHHQKQSFMDEYTMLLKDFQIDYEDKFIFKPLE